MGKLNNALKKLGKGLTGKNIRSNKLGAIIEETADNLDIQSDLEGKADLVNGKVPAAQLPSYVDDVIEVASFSALPEEGETGKIYVTLDTNLTYRYSGSTYVQVNEVDLGNYYTKAQADAEFVTKESGKGLSDNNFTDDEAQKLAGVEAGAEVNVIEGLQVNGVDVEVSGKKVNVVLPTKVSDLDNDSDFAAKSYVDNAITGAINSSY